MTHVALLRLSWPPQPLWQNRPNHWRKRADTVREYRKEAWAKALEQGVKRVGDNPTLTFTFCPPDRRRRDIQNMPATQKAAIDGIADAMGVDDSTFSVVFPSRFDEPVKGGCVLVEIKTIEA